jgi:hypothetical protein
LCNGSSFSPPCRLDAGSSLSRAGAVNDPHHLYMSTPEGRLPSCLCLHCITLPICTRAPHLCMSMPDQFSSCLCRHLQLRPFHLCKSMPKGRPPSYLCWHSQLPPSLPLICACQCTKGQPCSHQRSQPASLGFACQCLRATSLVSASVFTVPPPSPQVSGLGSDLRSRFAQLIEPGPLG